MCRWFCYISPSEPQLLQDILLKPKHSVIKQIDTHYLPAIHKEFQASDDGSPNPTTNMDGFGLGYWTTTNAEYQKFVQSPSENQSSQASLDAMRPVVTKSIRPPLNDLNLLSLCAGTQSLGVLCHIRAGTGLTPVVETNNHPFAFGRYLFAHNGTLGQFSSLKVRLLSSLSRSARLAVLGTTDSEHIAALFFDILSNRSGDWSTGRVYSMEQLRTTMRQTLAQLEIWISECNEEDKAEGVSPEKEVFSALNLVVSDGTTLLAIRYASPQPREPPSLYYSTTAGAAFNSKFQGHPDEGHPDVSSTETSQQGDRQRDEHGAHVIVASEPSTYDDKEWTLIEPNHIVSVERDMKVYVEGI